MKDKVDISKAANYIGNTFGTSKDESAHIVEMVLSFIEPTGRELMFKIFLPSFDLYDLQVSAFRMPGKKFEVFENDEWRASFSDQPTLIEWVYKKYIK